MAQTDHRIQALETKLQYIPGADDGHSAGVLPDMLAELRLKKDDSPGAEPPRESR